MIFVVGALLVGFVLAAVGAYAVARVELKSGLPPTLSWRLGLSGLQAYLSTWTVVQVAASVVLQAAPLEDQAARFADLLVRVTLSAVVLWVPFGIAVLVLGGRAYWRGDRDALAAPLFAAATYAVALLAVAASGWLEGPLGG